ncbi:Eisosomes component [Vermiconidia calcicola]|uniref:Eisosomes component n=1 Tax=Vermiconidia calcicola TaxID=1690605 RepID=A0ACC3N517_9PEZI|nr:Eisosomes component [Vermiconidia calcicola]
MAARPILSIVAIILLAGGVLLQLLVVLSGAINSNPINKIFFLQGSTDGIDGSSVPNPARWTYFAICGERNGLNAQCGPVQAAIPFDPKRNFGTSMGLPDRFTSGDAASTFYYLSRIAWAFFIIALFFAAVALLMSVIAIFSRLAAKFTGLVTIMALVCQAVACALMTAWTVIGRQAFRSNGQTATLGKYAYGFTWGAMACFLIATILLCIGGSKGKDDYSKSSSFGRKRSTRSRGSFRDSESGRRVKDEYE